MLQVFLTERASQLASDAMELVCDGTRWCCEISTGGFRDALAKNIVINQIKYKEVEFQGLKRQAYC
jgi:hypothetical protein